MQSAAGGRFGHGALISLPGKTAKSEGFQQRHAQRGSETIRMAAALQDRVDVSRTAAEKGCR
jgi:hypothetical protein